jgi:hypothetical protein
MPRIGRPARGRRSTRPCWPAPPNAAARWRARRRTARFARSGEILGHVDELAAPVVAPARIALGVLVREHRAHRLEHGRDTKFSEAISSSPSDPAFGPRAASTSWISDRRTSAWSIMLRYVRCRCRPPLDALLGDPVGGLGGWNSLALRPARRCGAACVDLARLALAPLERPVLELAVDVDQPARVDHVVGGVEDARARAASSVLAARELVVRRAGDDVDLEAGSSRRSPPPRGRTARRRRPRRRRCRRGRRPRAELLDDPLHTLGVDVGHGQRAPSAARSSQR